MAPEDDLPKLFAEKVRSIELERQVAPVFEGALGAGTFTIECRGDICKVRSTAHEWWKTVQFDRTVRARTSDMLFWGADVYVRAKSPAS